MTLIYLFFLKKKQDFFLNVYQKNMNVYQKDSIRYIIFKIFNVMVFIVKNVYITYTVNINVIKSGILKNTITYLKQYTLDIQN